MNGTFEISIYDLALYSLVYLIPIGILTFYGLKMNVRVLVSLLRMIIQLTLVGIYLQYIFDLHSFSANILWVLIMITVANISVLNRSGLKIRYFIPYTVPCFFITIAFGISSLMLVIDPQELIRARYFIPLGGMILGNMLRANIVVLDRFYSEIYMNINEYIHFISLGAAKNEALKPFKKISCKAAIEPQIATLATMGLVSLPGMMTGQILGGSSPANAIKYQILIMGAIFSSTALSCFLSLEFSQKAAFDSYDRLKEDVFTLKD